jgi:hypothetical protein
MNLFCARWSKSSSTVHALSFIGMNARDGNRTRTPLAGLRILSLDWKNVIYDETSI